MTVALVGAERRAQQSRRSARGDGEQSVRNVEDELGKVGSTAGRHFLAPGGEIEAGKLFPNFSGYEAKIEPLLEKRGLTSK